MSSSILELALRIAREEGGGALVHPLEGAPCTTHAPEPENPHPCIACGQPADASTLYCPPCWTRRQERGRLLAFDPTRAARTAAALDERYCETCGFGFWRVTPRGDAECYACVLLREGKRVRCAGCGLEEWRRDEHGRRACVTCAGGDARVAPPPSIVAPESTSSEIPAPGAA
jgi:hypothetical protein